MPAIVKAGPITITQTYVGQFTTSSGGPNTSVVGNIQGPTRMIARVFKLNKWWQRPNQTGKPIIHVVSLTDSFGLSDTNIIYTSLLSLFESLDLTDLAAVGVISGSAGPIFKSPRRKWQFKSPKRRVP